MKYSEYKKLTPEQKQEAFESYLSAWLEAHNNYPLDLIAFALSLHSYFTRLQQILQ